MRERRKGLRLGPFTLALLLAILGREFPGACDAQRYYSRDTDSSYRDDFGTYDYVGGRRVYLTCHIDTYSPERDRCGSVVGRPSSVGGGISRLYGRNRPNYYSNYYGRDGNSLGAYNMVGYLPRYGSGGGGVGGGRGRYYTRSYYRNYNYYRDVDEGTCPYSNYDLDGGEMINSRSRGRDYYYSGRRRYFRVGKRVQSGEQKNRTEPRFPTANEINVDEKDRKRMGEGDDNDDRGGKQLYSRTSWYSGPGGSGFVNVGNGPTYYGSGADYYNDDDLNYEDYYGGGTSSSSCQNTCVWEAELYCDPNSSSGTYYDGDAAYYDDVGNNYYGSGVGGGEVVDDDADAVITSRNRYYYRSYGRFRNSASRRVRWTRVGDTYNRDVMDYFNRADRRRADLTDDGLTLVIYKVLPEDKGTYICEYSDTRGVYRGEVRFYPKYPNFRSRC